jgi:hypothetical protein
MAIKTGKFQLSLIASFSKEDSDTLLYFLSEVKDDSSNIMRNKRVKKYLDPMEYVDGGYEKKDVLFGRGGRSNEHDGNKEYLKVVKFHKAFYREATNEEKLQTVEDIWNTIHAKGGRFLEQEKELPKRWFVAHKKEAFKKVGQALRDKRASVV